MPSNTFSTHAPTGQNATTIVSSNEYAPSATTIGYPQTFDLYVKKLPQKDSSQAIEESREVSHLAGSRLYLYHRPLINADGTVTTITVSDGTLDTTLTNARQGYIVFSVLPTAAFTVNYTAAPDCESLVYINAIQDSIMEMQQVLGPTALTGYPGLRNLKYGLFDSPADVHASGVAQNAVFLSHLDQNIRISSTNDAGLIARGVRHTIQLGRETDSVIVDATGFTVYQSVGVNPLTINLGLRTGDNIYYKGSLSGAGPVTIGGPEWSNYSGKIFSTELTGTFYSGAMLKVHGDIAAMGNIKAYGALTLITATGTTSQVLGDWTVGDELRVYGQTHLYGDTDTQNINVQRNLLLDGDLIAGNQYGAGGNGQTTIDNLDCSEVAWTYTAGIQRVYPNSVVAGPYKKVYNTPKKRVITPWFTLEGNRMAGDQLILTGRLNATAGPSGANPAILQLLLGVPVVSGFYSYATGFTSGLWSPGMMDPGSLWVEMIDGGAVGYKAPIYNYTVEATGANTIDRLNVFCPSLTTGTIPATNERFILYNPGNVPYDFITAAGGASPTFAVSGSSTDPLIVSFNNHVRILTSKTANQSLATALEYSVSGNGGTSPTGVAYIIADSNGVDVENAPIFRARAVPFRMPNETVIGEVVASKAAGTWTVLDTVSYRPNGFYDSAWIPVIKDPNISTTSGRCLPGFTSASTTPLRVYFNHDLGPDLDFTKVKADLYLGTPSTKSPLDQGYTQTMPYTNSMFGQDVRNPHGLSGVLIHVPLGAKRVSSATTERDASVIYFDSRLIGVDLSPDLMDGFPTGAASTPVPTYARLVVKRDV